MLKINGLYKSFNIGTDFENNLFNNFSIEFESQKTTALIGSNGCGKSTLLNLIAGSLNVDGGIIELDKKNITKLKEEKRAKYIGRVQQNPSMGVAPSLTILENMALADRQNKKISLKNLIKKERIPLYIEQLKTLDLGLENKLDNKVSLLSGGQRQSLSLLMEAMKTPKILLLDEHTAALDPKTSKVVMDKTLELIREKNLTTIMITHNMRDAVNYSDRIIMLDRGKIVLDKKSFEITPEELYQIYENKILEMEV